MKKDCYDANSEFSNTLKLNHIFFFRKVFCYWTVLFVFPLF